MENRQRVGDACETKKGSSTNVINVSEGERKEKGTEDTLRTTSQVRRKCFLLPRFVLKTFFFIHYLYIYYYVWVEDDSPWMMFEVFSSL